MQKCAVRSNFGSSLSIMNLLSYSLILSLFALQADRNAWIVDSYGSIAQEISHAPNKSPQHHRKAVSLEESVSEAQGSSESELVDSSESEDSSSEDGGDDE